MRLIRLAVAVVVCSILFGCGGGGGGTSNVATTPVKMDIHWPARVRALEAPSSALSAVITLSHANSDGADFTWAIDRGSDVSDHTASYTSPNQARIGQTDVTIRFYANATGTGAVVATGSATVTINSDGTGIGSVAINNVTSAVSIPPGQTINVGEAKDLTFSATDSTGAIIAATPGSAVWNVTAGSDKLRINPNGQAEGLVPGAATLTVTVDGKTSAPQTVSVVSNATVTITPSQMAMPFNSSRTFVATVTNAPDTTVTWSVREGGAGGTIDRFGDYVAPATPGTYHVVATSNYDPSKSAAAIVAVSATGVVSVSISPPAVTIPIKAIQTFTAAVSGAPDTSVTWSVQEGAAGGVITSGGVYTAPAIAGTYHVVATSVFDTNAKTTATVTVQSGGSTVTIH